MKNNAKANAEEEKILKEILAEGNDDDATAEETEESDSATTGQHEMWKNLSPDTPFWEQLDKQLVSMQEQVYLLWPSYKRSVRIASPLWGGEEGGKTHCGYLQSQNLRLSWCVYVCWKCSARLLPTEEW